MDKFVRKLWIKYSTKLSTKYKINKNSFIHKLSFCLLNKKSKDYSKIFGDELIKLAEKNDKIVAITAAMSDGTGLTDFKQKFSNRFFDVGIAEQHAIGMAAGMAKSGLIPIVPIYASFYQRAYDQVIHDVCMQNLHVVMCADRARYCRK